MICVDVLLFDKGVFLLYEMSCMICVDVLWRW